MGQLGAIYKDDCPECYSFRLPQVLRSKPTTVLKLLLTFGLFLLAASNSCGAMRFAYCPASYIADAMYIMATSLNIAPPFLLSDKNSLNW